MNQADQDGWDTGLVEKIVGACCNPNLAVPKSQGTFETSSGQTRKVVTTKGWNEQVRWKDRSTNWLPFPEVKAGSPIELAEYAIANGLESEHAFSWWVKLTLRQRDRLIERLKAQRMRKGRMKFGIELPGTVEEAKKFDTKNGNTFWSDVI